MEREGVKQISFAPEEIQELAIGSDKQQNQTKSPQLTEGGIPKRLCPELVRIEDLLRRNSYESLERKWSHLTEGWNGWCV